MTFIAVVVMALSFTIASYCFKKGMLAFAASGAWTVSAVYSYTNSAAVWDIYFFEFLLFCGLIIACAFSPLAYRETTPEDEPPEDPDIKELREEIEGMRKLREQYSFLYSRRKPRKRSRYEGANKW